MDIHIRRLSPAYDGLRIVHLTDIHHSLYTPLEDVERAVKMTNHLQPDLICLTGDYVTFSPTYIWPVAQVLGRLRSDRVMQLPAPPRQAPAMGRPRKPGGQPGWHA